MQDISRLREEFLACQKILRALGDTNRQHLILVMMQMEQCDGVRVGEIVKKTNLSRPAVSRHLQVLKDVGIIKVRREGTKNYYYFDADTKAMDDLLQLLTHAQSVMKGLPDRSGENE